VISVTLDNVIESELIRYENNYKPLNLINTALCRNVYNSLSPRNCSRCLVKIAQHL
jgi:hypothetical protein